MKKTLHKVDVHADICTDDYVDCLVHYTAPDIAEARELVYRWACVCRLSPILVFEEGKERELQVTTPDLFADGSMGETLAKIERRFSERLPALVNLALDTEDFRVWMEAFDRVSEVASDKEAFADILELFEDFDACECILWVARELRLPAGALQAFSRETNKMRLRLVTSPECFPALGDYAYMTLWAAHPRRINYKAFGGTLDKFIYVCQQINGQCVEEGNEPPYPEFGVPKH